MNMKLFGICAALISLGGHQAYAFDIRDILADPMIQCTTSSNNNSFTDESRDVSLAQRQVISQCQANPSTENAECVANVACNDGRSYPPMISCSTSSNNNSFTDESRDRRVAQQQAISQCQASPSTDNAECAANISCGRDGSTTSRRTPPMISCSTTSNGNSFSDESRDSNLARQQTVSQCQANRSTDNAECAANVTCNDGGYYQPMISCGTWSNGNSFTDESRDRSLAASQAIKQCQANRSTDNMECSANVACNDGSYYPPYVFCETSSNGNSFSNESRDSRLAQQQAVKQCQANRSTDNAECAANVACNVR